MAREERARREELSTKDSINCISVIDTAHNIDNNSAISNGMHYEAGEYQFGTSYDGLGDRTSTRNGGCATFRGTPPALLV